MTPNTRKAVEWVIRAVLIVGIAALPTACFVGLFAPSTAVLAAVLFSAFASLVVADFRLYERVTHAYENGGDPACAHHLDSPVAVRAWLAKRIGSPRAVLARELATQMAKLRRDGMVHARTIADLTDRMAQEVLGWHVEPDDPRRLWRHTDGTPVRVDAWADGLVVCKLPWIDGINGDCDIGYSPAYNFHSQQIDWAAWTQLAALYPAINRPGVSIQFMQTNNERSEEVV